MLHPWDVVNVSAARAVSGYNHGALVMNLTKRLVLCTLVALGLGAAVDLLAQAPGSTGGGPAATLESSPGPPSLVGSAADRVQQHATSRLHIDFETLQRFRPAFRFWRHIFTVPDGHIAFGSAVDGRLLVTVPARGDWAREAAWEDASLATILEGRRLPSRLEQRRDELARLLEPQAGPLVQNATRGLSVLPNARRYGPFLSEWGAIYERFGVPAEIGLAQAIVESGLNGTVRSEARAVGFCQWLLRNWNVVKRLAPYVIEGHNQTTQAPYCAAYLTILATKYGSFIPALSEHHTGGTNVGRVLINGERLGGADTRERYFLGSAFARDLRQVSPRTFRDVYGTYGLRSALYAEMVFGNAANVAHLVATTPQERVFAMRTRRAVTLTEVARAAKVPADEVRRFNPALRQRVPAGAAVYLPSHVPALGADISFWHRPPTPEYASVLNDFLSLNLSIEEWDSRSFDPVLREFRQRFEATKTEEGSIMATMLGYVLVTQRASRQGAILAEFRESDRILRLFERGRREWDAFRAASAASSVTTN